MADEKATIPTWGYSKEDAKIFDLKDGESLPKGYYDSPAALDEPETKKTGPGKSDKTKSPAA